MTENRSFSLRGFVNHRGEERAAIWVSWNRPEPSCPSAVILDSFSDDELDSLALAIAAYKATKAALRKGWNDG
jgi:hypothetical protein